MFYLFKNGLMKTVAFLISARNRSQMKTVTLTTRFFLPYNAGILRGGIHLVANF